MAQYIVKDKAGLVLLTLENPSQEDIGNALSPFWEKGLKHDDLVCSFAPEDKPKVRKPRSDKGTSKKKQAPAKRVRSRGTYFVVTGDGDIHEAKDRVDLESALEQWNDVKDIIYGVRIKAEKKVRYKLNRIQYTQGTA